jgi:DNA-binding XRE family transcriptional regulator
MQMSWCNITPAWALQDITKCYVYAHIHPVTKEAFYIGKGTKNRAYDLKGRSAAWKKIHNELKEEGLAHEIKILHICDSDEEALKKEKEEVRKLTSNGKKLSNVLVFKNKTAIAESNADIGDFIKELRLRKNLTQAQLGKRARCPQTTISKIELGALNITLKTFNRIMDALGVTISFSQK